MKKKVKERKSRLIGYVRDYRGVTSGGIRGIVRVNALDCWSTGRAIDPALGACFTLKFISLAQVVPGSVKPCSAER